MEVKGSVHGCSGNLWKWPRIARTSKSLLTHRTSFFQKQMEKQCIKEKNKEKGLVWFGLLPMKSKRRKPLTKHFPMWFKLGQPIMAEDNCAFIFFFSDIFKFGKVFVVLLPFNISKLSLVPPPEWFSALKKFRTYPVEEVHY